MVRGGRRTSSRLREEAEERLRTDRRVGVFMVAVLLLSLFCLLVRSAVAAREGTFWVVARPWRGLAGLGAASFERGHGR